MKLKDKIQALLRSSAYREDYQTFIASLSPGEIGCSYVDDGTGADIFCNDQVEAIRQKYAIPSLVDPTETPAEGLDAFFPSAWTEPLKIDGKKKIYGPTLDGFLTMKIDLTRNLDDIERDVRGLCKRFKKSIEKLSSQKRESRGRDCWEVFDLIEAGLSIDEVTVRLFNYPHKPNTKDYRYDDYCNDKNSIKSAYKRAKELLAEFEGK